MQWYPDNRPQCNNEKSQRRFIPLAFEAIFTPSRVQKGSHAVLTLVGIAPGCNACTDELLTGPPA